jgi:hypothetical protein
MSVGVGIIAAFAVGYFWLKSDGEKERAAVTETVELFLTSLARSEFGEARSVVCPEEVDRFVSGRAELTDAFHGYDGHRRLKSSELTVPFPRGPRTFQYDAMTHFSDGTEGVVTGHLQKRGGSWCILGLEYSNRDRRAPIATGANPSPTNQTSATEPATGQGIEFQWLETDGGCNIRTVLSGSASEVEFLAVRFRGTGFANGEKVIVELFRNESSNRLTVPLTVPPGGGVNNLCLYGPIQGQSPGGWPAGLYKIQFRLVGGATVGGGDLRIE